MTNAVIPGPESGHGSCVNQYQTTPPRSIIDSCMMQGGRGPESNGAGLGELTIAVDSAYLETSLEGLWQVVATDLNPLDVYICLLSVMSTQSSSAQPARALNVISIQQGLCSAVVSQPPQQPLQTWSQFHSEASLLTAGCTPKRRHAYQYCCDPDL